MRHPGCFNGKSPRSHETSSNLADEDPATAHRLWGQAAVMPARMRLLLSLPAVLLAVAAFPHAGQAQGTEVIHVFFSAGCADCWPYVESELIPALQAGGIRLESEIHDYTVPAERTRLLEMADDLELPRSIADSLYAFIPLRGGTLLVLGHVPAEVIRQAVT